MVAHGEVAEWLNALVSKTGIPMYRDRGFESLPLRTEYLVSDDPSGLSFPIQKDQELILDLFVCHKRNYLTVTYL